jgi:3-oxoacyl-[acyl-carrier protein] reductase
MSEMGRRLDDRVAIIIGAAQGIGAATAHRFAREGASVMVGDIDEVGGARLAAELGATAAFHRVNVAREKDVQAIVDAALERFGRVDILVQNAGIYPPTLIADTSLEQWNHVLGVNLTGCFLATRACMPSMRAQKRGRIVLLSSITGPRVSNPGMSAYAASKAGINGFIRTAALELAGDGITVNGIEPGNIMTEGLAAGRSDDFISGMVKSIPLGRLGAPEDIASAALFLASDEASYITGTTIIVDGGQILPEALDTGNEASWQ